MEIWKVVTVAASFAAGALFHRFTFWSGFQHGFARGYLCCRLDMKNPEIVATWERLDSEADLKAAWKRHKEQR